MSNWGMLVRQADGKHWGGQAGCDACENQKQAGHFVCSPWGQQDGAEVLFRTYSDCQVEVCKLAAEILNDEGGDWQEALRFAEDEVFFQPTATGRPAPCHCGRPSCEPRQGTLLEAVLLTAGPRLIALLCGVAIGEMEWGVPWWVKVPLAGGIYLATALACNRWERRHASRRRDPLLEALED